MCRWLVSTVLYLSRIFSLYKFIRCYLKLKLFYKIESPVRRERILRKRFFFSEALKSASFSNVLNEHMIKIIFLLMNDFLKKRNASKHFFHWEWIWGTENPRMTVAPPLITIFFDVRKEFSKSSLSS